MAEPQPSRGPRRPASPASGRAGVAGLAVIALLIWRTSQYSPFLYLGGNVLLSVSTVGVVAALAHPASWLGPALVAPLRWLGVRSYGIYLWHFPIIVLTTPAVQRSVDLPADPPGGGDHCRGRPVLALRRRTDPPRRPRAHLGANQIMGVAPKAVHDRPSHDGSIGANVGSGLLPG